MAGTANRDAYEIIIGALARFEESLYDTNERLLKQSDDMYDAMEGDDYSKELCDNLYEFAARMNRYIEDVGTVKEKLIGRKEELFE